MSNNIVVTVKEFLVKLVKDRGFQEQLNNSSVEERAKLLKVAGYSFSKAEFETAVIELLEAKEQGQLNELSEDELVAVVGGCYMGESKPKPSCMHVPGWNPINPLENPINEFTFPGGIDPLVSLPG